MPRVELRQIFRQDPSGDIARNAQLVNAGRFPAHMRRFDSVGALERAAASTGALRERPSGCVFVQASSEGAAADAVCGGVLDWLQRGGCGLRADVLTLDCPDCLDCFGMIFLIAFLMNE